MVDLIRENTGSFIIVFLTMMVISLLVYKIYHVDCDPQAVDKFNEFVLKFEDCINGNCDSFDRTNIPLQHEILLNSKNGITSIELFCKGKGGKSETFENLGLCIYSSANDEIYRGLEELRLSKISGTEHSLYSPDGVVELRKAGNDICFVNNIGV